LFDDFEAEAFEGGDVHGGVREQADAADAQVKEDLAAEAYGSDGAAVAIFVMFEGAEFGVQEQARGGCGVFWIEFVGGEFEAAAGVVQVEKDSAACLNDHAHGLVENFAALAVGGEDVSGGAAGVDADQDGVGVFAMVAVGVIGNVAEAAMDERDVAFAAVDFALVGDHAEVAVAGVDGALGGAGDVALVLQPVANEFGYGEHLEAVLGAELDQVWDAGHGAVVVHDFADDAGGIETGEAGEIDGSFGLTGADEDSAFARAEGENVAGASEVVGRGTGRYGSADGVGAVIGGDAGGDAFAGLDGLGECGSEAGGVLLGHGRQVEVVCSILGEGEADESSAVAGHEIDGFGGDEFGGQGEVALVFAVFVIDNYDHAAGAELNEGCGNIYEWVGNCSIWHGRLAVKWLSGYPFIVAQSAAKDKSS